MPPKIWSPRLWGVHLLALVLLAGTIGLGLWQIGVWREHRSDESRDVTQAAAKPLSAVMGPDDPYPGLLSGHLVQISGEWVPSGTVYVSGRRNKGADGYWAVTPVSVGGPGQPAIPVVRGWMASPSEAPSPPTGSVELTGWLQPPEGANGLDDEDPTDDVLPQLRIADVIQHVDQDLYGAYVVDRDPEPGLERASLAELPGAGTLTGLRNFLYGLEWWVFSGFVIYVWWRHVQELTRSAPTDPAAEESPIDDHVPSV